MRDIMLSQSQVTQWADIDQAVSYFIEQGHDEIMFVNKFELRSLDLLRQKLGIPYDAFIDLINLGLSCAKRTTLDKGSFDTTTAID